MSSVPGEPIEELPVAAAAAVALRVALESTPPLFGEAEIFKRSKRVEKN